MSLPGLTTFLAAALLFMVQPLLGAHLLPTFGGGSAVWATCLASYQLLLLGGYLWVHAGARVGPRRQARWQLALVGLCGGWLLAQGLWWGRPLLAPTRAAGDPALAVLGALALGVGPPFVVLAASCPLLAGWQRARGLDPYRLYAISNAGSLFGLLGYPLLIEPWLASGQQALLWSGGFALFAGLLFASARQLPEGAQAPRAASRGWPWWIALAAGPTALLVAVSNHVCHELAPTPLLWVAPLAVYLLSLIVPFSWPPGPAGRPSLALGWLGLASVALVFLPLLELPLLLQVALSLTALGALAALAHVELARRRPAEGGTSLYYAAIAGGGAAGGLLAALLAPRLLHDRWELHLAFALTALLVVVVRQRDRWGLTVAWWAWLLLLIAALGHHAQQRWHRLAGQRSFYGVARVQPVEVPYRGRGWLGFTLIHDGTRHGLQLVELPTLPTSYYGPASGVGRLLRVARRRHRALRVGAIGLGTGAIATYLRPRDRMCFYELAPEIAELAQDRRYFTYLAGSRGEVEVRIGDGRALLREERRAGAPPHDVLVLDAFSGGAVPAHLLTIEAGRLYRQRLTARGVLAVHISGAGVVDLQPVLAGMARELGWQARRLFDPGEPGGVQVASEWVLLAAPGVLDGAAELAEARPLEVRPWAWRDDRHSLLPLLRLGR